MNLKGIGLKSALLPLALWGGITAGSRPLLAQQANDPDKVILNTAPAVLRGPDGRFDEFVCTSNRNVAYDCRLSEASKQAYLLNHPGKENQTPIPAPSAPLTEELPGYIGSFSFKCTASSGAGSPLDFSYRCVSPAATAAMKRSDAAASNFLGAVTLGGLGLLALAGVAKSRED